jgi:prephenate dehydrogenase
VPTILPMADARQGDAGPPPFARIAIVGYGLMGASLGLAIKEQWPSALVVAVDRKPVIEAAMRRHAADVGGDDLGLAGGTELVVLAAPVRANIRLLADLPRYVEGDALVTDLGSTKREIVAAARALPARLRFVGGHPLAGAAVRGLEAARADLFRGRPWVLTPDEAGESRDALALGAMLESIGATVQMLTPGEHDRLVAYLSHLPQLTATALMHVVGTRAGQDGLALAGRGLRDTTRLASSPGDIWADILATNADNIGPAIDELIEMLQRLKADAGEGPATTRAFASAAEWKRVLDGQFEGS